MRWSLTLLLAVVVNVAGGADRPMWKEFESRDGRFQVLMPATPMPDQLESESDFGKGVLHMNTARVGRTMYAANYSDFPAGIKKVPIKQVLDSSRDGAVANLEGRLAEEKTVKSGSHSGREVRIEVAGGRQLFRARVYLVDQRLYQVVVFGIKEAATSKDADKFLDSFKVIEKTTPAPKNRP